MVARQLRALAGRPAHLTHESNASIRLRFGCAELTEDLLQAATKKHKELQALRHSQPDNLATRDIALQQLEMAISTFRQVVPVAQPVREGVEGIGCPCPVCGVYFDSRTSVKKHIAIKHPEHKTTDITFDPAVHALGGLPQCSACKHKFQSWQALKNHIQNDNCAELERATTATARTQDASGQDGLRIPPHRNPQVATIIREQGWEALVTSPFADELRQHCCLCARWIVDPTALKRHISKAHKQLWALASAQIEGTCAVFKSRLTRDGLSATTKRPPATPMQGTKAEEEDSETPGTQGKRKRTRRGGGSNGSRASAPNHPVMTKDMGKIIHLISRILTQHEDSINAAKMDRGFTIFMAQTGPAGLLTNLYQASIAWNKLRETEPQKITQPPRITLLTLMIAELGVRLQNLDQQPEAKKLAQGRLLYQKWDGENKKLIPNPTMNGLEIEEVKQMLKEMEPLILEDLLEISLRHPEANLLYQNMAKLADNAVWQLIGCQIRKDGMRRRYKS
ncbi:unnamed protein product [Symbiodinium sp. CCMP2592]|nr:unnamed protein product [Symbiodinium sp. CCMP2592]